MEGKGRVNSCGFSGTSSRSTISRTPSDVPPPKKGYPVRHATLGRLDPFMPTPSHPKLGGVPSPREEKTQTPIAMLRERGFPPDARNITPGGPGEESVGEGRRGSKMETRHALDRT